MEWAGGGPLSSYPLPEPKSGVTLPPLRARPGKKVVLKGKCLEPCQTQDPPPSHQGPQSSGREPLPHRLSGHCSGENRATQPGPAPVPVSPVTLSCHSPERLHLTTKLRIPDCPGWQQVEGLPVFAAAPVVSAEAQSGTIARKKNSNQALPACRAPVLSTALNGSVWQGLSKGARGRLGGLCFFSVAPTSSPLSHSLVLYLPFQQ